MTAGIQLDGVWKRYALGEAAGIRGLFSRGQPGSEFWSLRDLNLRVEPGESIGLIGHNGAGKSTTLKLLAGITRPTRGRVHTQGRIASLINLGAGFHRELTGRENVFLNGVILGLTRREVRERFDDIVEFADIGEYVDTPVKQYSTGMYARLGFAVAAHVDPDILLVDEVLSVGDVEFQDRSLRKMLSFRDRGCGIVFVSHNLSAIEMMCQRAVWLDHGVARLEGPATEVVRAYLDAVDRDIVAADSEVAEEPLASVDIQKVSVHSADGRACADFEDDGPFFVRLECRVREVVESPKLRITVRGDYGPLFSAQTSVTPRWNPGLQRIECHFARLPLLPGLYRVETLLHHAASAPHAAPATMAAFRVNTDLAAFGSDSVVGVTKSRGGFLAVPYSWRIETVDGTLDLDGLHAPSPSQPPES